MTDAGDIWKDHVEAEWRRLLGAGIPREAAIARLGATIERIEAALARATEPAGGDPHRLRAALAEARREHDGYRWDELGIFSDHDVIHSLAEATALARFLDGLAGGDDAP